MTQAHLWETVGSPRPERRRAARDPHPPDVHEIPLSTGDCARYMDRSTQFIRQAIASGALQATRVRQPGHPQGRWYILPSAFLAYLIAIGWPHLPRT